MMYRLMTNREYVPLVAGTLLLVLTVPAVWAREATVRTRDGRELTGELVTQNDKVVVLNISGIEISVQRDQVAEFELKPTADEYYAQTRPELDDNDLEGRFALSQRLYEMKALDLALRELQDLARLFPGEPRVVRLINIIEADQELARRQVDTGNDPRRVREDQGRPPRNPGRAQPAEAGELLTPEQVNLIRVYEVDLSAQPRGIRVPRETLDKFFQSYRDADGQPLDRRAQAEFRRRPPYEQLEEIFAARLRDLYGEVEILTDPPALATYRNTVNDDYVAPYFRRHFGQGQVDGLKLFGARPNAVEEAYTNFYVLHNYKGPEGVPMIDRVSPADSLLVQWGLPRELATSPAPQVEGWEPAFRSVDDPQFLRIVDWIGTLYSPAPDYGIDYPPAAPAAPDADTPAPAN